MKQTWAHTWFEVWTNIVLGYTIATIGNWLYLYASGYSLGFWEVNGLGLFMTVLSIIRQLCVRRFFEFLRIRQLEKVNASRS